MTTQPSYSLSSSVVLDLLHNLGWILVSNIQLDLELLARPVDRSQGLTYHPGKVTVTLLFVVHERITDELGDLPLRPYRLYLESMAWS